MMYCPCSLLEVEFGTCFELEVSFATSTILTHISSNGPDNEQKVL